MKKQEYKKYANTKSVLALSERSLNNETIKAIEQSVDTAVAAINRECPEFMDGEGYMVTEGNRNLSTAYNALMSILVLIDAERN